MRATSNVDRTDSTTSSTKSPVGLKKRLQSSKSENSLSESVGGSSVVAPSDAFEVITEAEIIEAQSQETLNSPQGKNEVLLPGEFPLPKIVNQIFEYEGNMNLIIVELFSCK